MGPGQMDPVLRKKSGGRGVAICLLVTQLGFLEVLVPLVPALSTTVHLVKDTCLGINQFYGVGH